MAFWPVHAALAERLPEFVREARFAEPGLSDELKGLALARFGAARPLVQLPPLAVAADKRRQPARPSSPTGCARGAATSDFIDDHRLALASDLDRVEQFGTDLAGDHLVHLLGDH
jgi:hypothetical protein